jgi:hypothetical protein
MADAIDPGFLVHSELFESQPEAVIRAVLAQGQLLEYGPGEIVFRQGDRGDRLFVVKSGVLEVLSTPTDTTEPVPVAYLGTGEVQLQGSLRYFDLATVIQTLIGSHQTGNLVVSREKQKMAEILFFRGNIYRARYRHLTGDDAVFQLFQSPVEGEFSFTGRDVEEDEVSTEVSLPAISLLMESVRLQDELPVLRERLPDPARVYRQKGNQLKWEDADTVELAASVWSRLKKGASLRDLEAEVPRCSYAIYWTVSTLLDGGQIE